MRIYIKTINNFGEAIYIYGAVVDSDVETMDWTFGNTSTGALTAIAFDNDANGMLDGNDINQGVSVELPALDLGLAETTPNAVSNSTDNYMKEGETRTILIKNLNGNTFSPGAKHRIQFEFRYYPATSGATYAKGIKGEIFSEVQTG